MSRELFDASVFEALPDALLVVKNERIVWVNAASLRMLGAVETDDVVGRAFEAILAPGERSRIARVEKLRSEPAAPTACRIRFIRMSDGGTVTTDVRFGDRDGQLIIAARDVTDVTRAEALMGTLAQTFARGTALLDADALLDAAEPTFEALRWKVAFLELMPSGSILRRLSATPHGEAIAECARSAPGIHVSFEKTPTLHDVVKKGMPAFLEELPTQSIRSAWCPILTNGRLTHLLVVSGRDLTEHDFVGVQLFAAQLGAAIHLSALRAALVQKERLAAVGQMAAVMAHEVRNPLGIIFNALSGLRRAVSDVKTGPALIDIIQEESNRLRRLVNDLLDFSRPSAVQIETVDVVPLLREAAKAACLDPTSGGSGTEIHFDIAEDLPAVETDPLLLRRALVNLLVNGLQNVSSDGRVSLAARPIGDELYVCIANDAVPMAPEVAARVFEPFFTTRAAGTGLGLAVVRRILDDLGGSVALEERAANAGTAFSLRLPFRAINIARSFG